MRGKNKSTHGLGVIDSGNKSLGRKGCSRNAEQWHYSRSIWKAGSPGDMTNEEGGMKDVSQFSGLSCW